MFVILTTATAAAAIVIAALGLVVPYWRSQPRSVYYSSTMIAGLLLILTGTAAMLLTNGHAFGWAPAAVAGWIVLEVAFALWKARSEK